MLPQEIRYDTSDDFENTATCDNWQALGGIGLIDSLPLWLEMWCTAVPMDSTFWFSTPTAANSS